MTLYKAITILVCALAAAPALAAEKTFDKHFNVPPGGHLKLETDVGSVAIVGREGREVVVHANLSGSSDFLSRFDMEAVQGSEGIAVSGRLKGHAWFGSWFETGTQKVVYTIDVPLDYPVEIHTSGGHLDIRHVYASVRGTTSGGNVSIRDVHGSIDARTSGGRIDAAGIKGPTQLHTAGGNIEVSDSTGDLDVSSSGGSIGLLLPATAHGSINARTSGGAVQSEIPLSRTETAGRGVLRGSINGGGEAIVLRTSGGNIHLGTMN